MSIQPREKVWDSVEKPVVFALALLSLIGTTTANDWPGFRGPTGQGTSTAKGLPTEWSGSENIAWKTELPGPGTSSPVVFGKKVFITCYSGFNVPGEEGQMEDLMLHLVCLDRATGKKLWTTDVKPKLPELEQFRRDKHGYASGTPAVDAERVYVFWGKTGAMAFDHGGKKLWEQDLGERIHEWGSCGSPVLHQNLVIINASVESDSLVALDKKTGKEVWRADDLKESWNTPILVKAGNKTELVVAEMGKILGYDPATGDELWSCDTDIPWYMVPSLLADKGIVYCVGGRSPGGSLAVKVGGRGDVTETHRLWTSNKGSNVTSPLYHDGHLYWMHESQEIAFCLKADTGKIVYEERVPRRDQMYPSPVLADGKIYYVNRTGTTFVVPAKPEFEILATNSLGERSEFMSSPAVSGKNLLIRSNKYLYCIGEE